MDSQRIGGLLNVHATTGWRESEIGEPHLARLAANGKVDSSNGRRMIEVRRYWPERALGAIALFSRHTMARTGSARHSSLLKLAGSYNFKRRSYLSNNVQVIRGEVGRNEFGFRSRHWI